MADDITLDEWLAEWEQIANENPDSEGFTTEELSEAWGVEPSAVRARLRVFQRAGRLESGRRQVEYINGTRGYVPVYRVVKGKKK